MAKRKNGPPGNPKLRKGISGNPLSRFKPGVSGNPLGSQKMPEELRTFGLDVKMAIMKYLLMTKASLQKLVIKDEMGIPLIDSLPMLDAIICSILINAFKTGDVGKIEFLLNRCIGRVKEEIPATDHNNIYMQIMNYIQMETKNESISQRPSN